MRLSRRDRGWDAAGALLVFALAVPPAMQPGPGWPAIIRVLSAAAV